MKRTFILLGALLLLTPLSTLQAADGPKPASSKPGTFALREGPWKFVPVRGNGGFSFPKNIKPAAGEPTGQLYNLATDPHETHETHNVAATEAPVAARIAKRLAEIQSTPRTRQ